MNQESSFNYQCLEASPCGVLILDASGTIRWLNPALEAMLGIDADQLVGQKEEGFPHPTHRGLFKDVDLLHLIGPGPNRECWLQCTIKQMQDANTSVQTVKYYLDVSEQMQLQEENRRLRQQVEELSITDNLTGLANRQALTRALNAQVARSRRYQNPLSVVVIDLQNRQAGQPIPDEVILAASQYLRDRLRWVDVIARWEHSQFIIVLPETNLQDAVDLMEKVTETFSEMLLPDQFREMELELSHGLAEWQRGQDAQLLMQQAFDNLTNDTTPTPES